MQFVQEAGLDADRRSDIGEGCADFVREHCKFEDEELVRSRSVAATRVII